MRVFYSADGLQPIKSPVVTVGSFDGLHYGHRVLLEEVKRHAAETGGESVVVTFWPHPRQVLPNGGHVKLLNTLDEKLFLLKEAGVGNVVVLPFTTGLAGMASDDFVREILVGKIGMKRLVVGYNHRFGSDQQGDFTSLQNMEGALGFVAERIPRLDVHEQKVSSTVIRNMILSGDMTKAAEFLTRGYILIAGIRGGRKVVAKDGGKLLPPAGMYPVRVETCAGTTDDMLYISSGGDLSLEQGVGEEHSDVLITFRQDEVCGNLK